MSDPIDRQTAIDTVKNVYKSVIPEDAEGWIIKGLENLPSIQSERKKGRWLSIPHKQARICSRCGFDEPYKCADDDAPIYSFCPYCGADMRGEQK